MSGIADISITLVELGIAIALYWLPTIVAKQRQVPNLMQIAVVNFFAFCLGIPWVIALAMAARNFDPPPPDTHDHARSLPPLRPLPSNTPARPLPERSQTRN